jgi:predicted enzyme related to lactoylglutathione lyase
MANNRVVHFEIPANQPEALTGFYSDIDAAIEKATKLEATVALPKMPVPGVGAFAAIVDPQRNIFGLWEQTAKQMLWEGRTAFGLACAQDNSCVDIFQS